MFCSLFWCNYLIAFPWRSGGFDSQNSLPGAPVSSHKEVDRVR